MYHAQAKEDDKSVVKLHIKHSLSSSLTENDNGRKVLLHILVDNPSLALASAHANSVISMMLYVILQVVDEGQHFVIGNTGYILEEGQLWALSLSHYTKELIKVCCVEGKYVVSCSNIQYWYARLVSNQGEYGR